MTRCEPGSETLRVTIKELYGLVHRLEKAYPGRHFTPDGHLVGSLGEVYAAEHYALSLFEASYPVHDAVTSDGRMVQIKATQGSRIALNECPDYLIVLRIDSEGEFEEVYNGPGGMVWDLVKDRKRPANGQYQVALSKLKRLNAGVYEEDRI